MLLCKKRHRFLAALASAAFLLVGCIDQRLRRQLAPADPELLASPAMHLVLCGTGSAIPDRSRAGSCSALAAAGHVLLVDVGPGAWEGAHFAGVPAGRIDGVFLTSLLVENVADLGELLIGSWIAGHARAGATLARFAAGCDVLVHEAAHPEMIRRAIRVMEELGDARLAGFSAEMLERHASPVEVARIARAAGVGRLVFSRVYPPLDDPLMRWAFLRGVRAVFPAAVIGEDAMRFRLDPQVPPPR